MNIVHVVSKYPPSLGGMQYVVRSIAERQFKRNARVKVITSNNGANNIDKDYDMLKVFRMKSFFVAHTTVIPGLFFKLLKEKKDSIIHVHVAQAYVPEVTFFAARLRRIPIIMHVHSDVAPSGSVGSFLLPIYKKTILGFLLRNSNKVIVLNNAYSDLIVKKYNVKRENIKIIPNGVDEIFYSNTKKLNTGTKKVLFVGRLNPEKNIDLLIEAISMVRSSAELNIVGDGPLLGKLKSKSKNLKKNSVVFHGYKKSNELIEFYAVADALVLCSDYEGQPTVIMEAMASATPVIGTNVIGIRDTIGSAGLLVDKNAKSIADAIDYVLGNEKIHFELSEKVRKKAKAFDWDRSIDELDKVYKSL